MINYEKYLLDKDGNHYSKSFSDLLYRYIERNFKSQIQSQYLENIRTHYLKNEELDIQVLLDAYQYASNVSYELYDEEDEIEDLPSYQTLEQERYNDRTVSQLEENEN